ncbi:hypothetical protein ADL04_13335 [Streptomyces sp. NRRL B-3648]|nr:hypothetical protein ADL04_13335 [Streptomyces sp. NRRL B-3648]
MYTVLFTPMSAPDRIVQTTAVVWSPWPSALRGSRTGVLRAGLGCSFRNDVMHRKPIAISVAVPKKG